MWQSQAPAGIANAGPLDPSEYGATDSVSSKRDIEEDTIAFRLGRVIPEDQDWADFAPKPLTS
jgi:hypothetical protein